MFGLIPKACTAILTPVLERKSPYELGYMHLVHH